MAKLLPLSTLIITALITLGCNNFSSNSKIVFKVANLEVTTYELQKQYNRFYHSISNIAPKTNDNFKSAMYNKYRIIADAYYKGYDTLASIQENIDEISDLMMVQKEGYLWKETALPVIEEYKKITPEKILKRSLLFYYDIIHFEDTSGLKSTFNSNTPLDIEAFNSLKSTCNNNKQFSYSFRVLQWPFMKFHELMDTLYALNVGSVTNIMESGGEYYCFHLHSVDSLTLTKNDENGLSIELGYVKERQIEDDQLEIMIQDGAPEFNSEAIGSIMKHLASGAHLFQYSNNDTLLAYYHQGELKHLLFHDFIIPISHYPFSPIITTEVMLRDQILDYYFREYKIQLAKDLNLYNDPIFLLDQKNYTNNLLYSFFINTEFLLKTQIDSADIIEYYRDHPEQFTNSKYMYCDCYFFNTKEDANSNRSVLTNYYRNHSTNSPFEFKNLFNPLYVIKDYKIDKQNLTGFNAVDLEKIQFLKPGEVSYCIEFQEKYALILNKFEDGQFCSPLADVFDRIKYSLEDIELDKHLKMKEEELKSVYPIKLDKIDQINLTALQ